MLEKVSSALTTTPTTIPHSSTFKTYSKIHTQNKSTMLLNTFTMSRNSQNFKKIRIIVAIRKPPIEQTRLSYGDLK